jgi:UDPglucose 6-dehydrogenase
LGSKGRNLFFSTDVKKQLKRLRLFLSRLIHPLKPYGKGKGMAADLNTLNVYEQIAKIEDDKIVVEKSNTTGTNS